MEKILCVMRTEDPEDIGIELADMIDKNAVIDESDKLTKSGLRGPIRKSFEIKFREENHKNSQTRILETACRDELSSMYTDVDSFSKEALISTARDYARDMYHEFYNYILNEIGVDDSVKYTEIPPSEDELFDFRDSIIDGYWNDVVPQMKEDYKK